MFLSFNWDNLIEFKSAESVFMSHYQNYGTKPLYRKFFAIMAEVKYLGTTKTDLYKGSFSLP
jgi:hypothetical protein